MSKSDIEKMLPHKSNMVLLDNFIEYNSSEKFVKAEFTIDSKSIFFDASINGVPALTGLEYMAQTIGCYAYYKNNQQPPRIGFLLGTRLYKSNSEVFENGKTYSTLAKEIFDDGQLVSFDCFIYNDNKELCAEAKVNAYMPKDEEELAGVIND